MEQREAPMPVQKDPEQRLLKPRMEHQPANPEAASFLKNEQDVSIRMIHNVATQRIMDHDPATLDQAIQTNEHGIGTLDRFNRLLTQQEGDAVDKQHNPSPINLGEQVSVKDTDGATRNITKVSGKKGGMFICEVVKPNGTPEGDITLSADEVLHAQLLADETELSQILTDPSVTDDERAVFEQYMQGMKGDTSQLETDLADPTKSQTLKDTISNAEESNGMVSERNIRTFVDHIAPERPLPADAKPDTIQAVQQANDRRQKLVTIAENASLSKGEKLAKICGYDLPQEKQKAHADVETLTTQLAHAQTEGMQTQIQNELNKAKDYAALLTEVEKQVNSQSPNQSSEFANIIDQIQNGSVKSALLDTIQEALQTGDKDKLIDIIFETDKKNVTSTREKQERSEARKEKLKKRGTMSLAVLLAVLAAGGMAAKGMQEE